MTYELEGDPDQLRDRFYRLKQPEDIATLLEVEYRDLNYWIYRTPKRRRYTTFRIRKRHGTPRRIDAPNTNIKILQQKLNQVLQSVYRPKPSVHGFVLGRNVRTNATKHVEKRWVFNIDLKDFFPSINFGRVRGMFMGKPYHRPERVATVLAHLCCFDKQLPQGAPTSPVISNMICAQMDSQLQRLAGANRCTYTRYADDITFSTTERSIRATIAVIDESGQIQLGQKLKSVIEKNGFKINENKVWLSGRERRQEVTGITVNDLANLPRKYTNQIRAMLHAWKEYDLCAAQEHFERRYDVKHRAEWRRSPKFEQVVKGKIEYLGMVKGANSLTYLRFLDQLRDLDRNLAGTRGTPLRLLQQTYDDLSHDSVNPQQRGYKLQDILNKLFKISCITVRRSFTRNEGGEQIDGAFELKSRHCLVECRWRQRMADVREVDGLLGQLGRSGDHAMGVFLSINGWSTNVPGLVKQNRIKRIILVNGEDIRRVLVGDIELTEMLDSKIKALDMDAEPFRSVEDILSRKAT